MKAKTKNTLHVEGGERKNEERSKAIKKSGLILREIKDWTIAFLLAFFAYKALGLALNTQVPIVSVSSRSMLPTLHVGDLAIAVGASEIRPGDIIIYAANCPALPREDIIHRVIAINNSYVITKGDNNATNPIPDPCPVSFRQIKGKVVLVLPLLGYPRLLLNWIVGI